MITETPPARSRRAILTAAIGASVATLAAGFGRPLPARAADGDPVLVGGSHTGTLPTMFDTSAANSPALFGATSELATGVAGTGNPGVAGSSLKGTGVEGISTPGNGVRGLSVTGCGVVGWSGGTTDIAPRKTGVYGFAAHDASSRGVHGDTSLGRGVLGSATSGSGVFGLSETGTAVYAFSADPLVGYALRAVGRVKLDQCAGRATIAAGTKSVVVIPGIDVVSTAAIVATLQGSAGGTTTVHRIAIDTVNNTFTIHLTANSTANVKVAWHIFG